MATPRVWVATFDEAETVARLLVDFRNHNGRDWPSENAFLASVERLLEQPGTEFLLGAPHDDAPPAAVAQLRFRHSIWVAGEDCWLEDVFVREHARRAGLGHALVAYAIERATERGARRIELDVRESNTVAQHLYERLGFSTRSKSSGDGPRDLFMGRMLEPPV